MFLNSPDVIFLPLPCYIAFPLLPFCYLICGFNTSLSRFVFSACPRNKSETDGDWLNQPSSPKWTHITPLFFLLQVIKPHGFLSYLSNYCMFALWGKAGCERQWAQYISSLLILSVFLAVIMDFNSSWSYHDVYREKLFSHDL